MSQRATRTTIRRSRPSAEYLTIPNATARDERLPLEASGLLLHLLSLPPDWEVVPAQIQASRKVGRDKLYRILRELRDAGYVELVEHRSAKGYVEHYDYVVHDQPLEPRSSEASASSEGVQIGAHPLLPEKPEAVDAGICADVLLPEKPYTANQEAVTSLYTNNRDAVPSELRTADAVSADPPTQAQQPSLLPPAAVAPPQPPSPRRRRTLPAQGAEDAAADLQLRREIGQATKAAVAAYCAEVDGTVQRHQVNHVSQMIRRILTDPDAPASPEEAQRAAADCARKGINPANIPSLLHELRFPGERQRRSAHPVGTRGMTEPVRAGYLGPLLPPGQIRAQVLGYIPTLEEIDELKRRHGIVDWTNLTREQVLEMTR